jgi:uncharacterized protein (UPF0332 family)
VTWQLGRERIEDLLARGELERVVPGDAVTDRLLDDARRHLATAETALRSGDLAGAYQLAYDALRKSAASLLSAQGLRATSRGGHIAIQDAVVAQFGTSAQVFRSFSRIRRARNSLEYPGSTDAPGPSAEDVANAIKVATQAHEAAATILEQDVLTTW